MRLSIRSLVTAVSAVVLWATPGGAQRSRNEFGVGIDWRRQLGAVPDSVERRTGLSIRLQGDIPWKRYVGFRVEGGYVQVKYDETA